MTSIFIGYPENPAAQAEVLRTFAEHLPQQVDVEVVSWESLKIEGRVVIDRILEAIDDADMAIFDVTELNQNVLFEAGYAIARGKPVWMTLDSTVRHSIRAFRDFAVLKEVGYVAYRNSGELVAKFVEKDPLADPRSIYDDVIDPVLAGPEPRRNVLYCPTFEPFEASSRLSHLVDDRRHRGVQVLISDPQESGLEPLTWYAPAILKSAGVLVHFAGKRRNRAAIHNHRHAFVAGLATGFGSDVLMLAEEDYSAPFDYQARLRKYDSASECVALARAWMDGLTLEGISWHAPRVELRSKLAGLRFGEHVAENELLELSDYFVETSAYEEVIAARDAIFVGHRGTGKTANATQAYEELAANKTNMVVLIKPPGFEFPALLTVLDRLPAFQHDYFFDALWRFVIQTEIAVTALKRIQEKAPGVPLDDAEQTFATYAQAAPFDMSADISVRLEQALDFLLERVDESGSADSSRNLVNEAFHSSALAELRAQLGPLLKSKHRVAVLIDNLDKGWERGANFGIMARLILGLLVARGRLVTDFRKQDYWRDEIKLTVSVFLRTDIYHYLKKEAREPDKLPISTIAWRDPETLLSVIESRYHGASASRYGAALWGGVFCESVKGVPTREYIVRLVLPRPRDIVYFCNAATGRAVDRRRERVEESDFESAEEMYSRYAYEALLVENGVTIPEMETALLGFLGADAIATRSEIVERLGTAGIPAERCEALLEKLVTMSFLALEISTDSFHYPEVGSDLQRAVALARQVQPDARLQRFSVHPAFHNFLAIKN